MRLSDIPRDINPDFEIGMHFLEVLDWSGGKHAKRIANLFERVWSRIPKGYRAILDECWDVEQRTIEIVNHPAKVFFDPKGHGGDGFSGTMAYVCCSVNPFLFILDERLVRLADDLVIETFIAHECGHIFLKAIGANDPNYQKDAKPEERMVHRLQKKMGYPHSPIDRWMRREDVKDVVIREWFFEYMDRNLAKKLVENILKLTKGNPEIDFLISRKAGEIVVSTLNRDGAVLQNFTEGEILKL